MLINNHQASQKAVELICGFESFRPKAYLCPSEVWTIGFGHTGGVMPNDTITFQEAMGLLRADMRSAEHTVNGSVMIPLEQHQFDALVSFVFNIGATQFLSSTLLKALNKGNLSEAKRQWMRWVYSKSKPLKGLHARREAEILMFNGVSSTITN